MVIPAPVWPALTLASLAALLTVCPPRDAARIIWPALRAVVLTTATGYVLWLFLGDLS